jgi:hypothetical protein
VLEEEDDDAEEEEDDDDDDDIDVSSSTFSDVSAVANDGANDIFNRRRGRQEEKVGVGDCLRRVEDHW